MRHITIRPETPTDTGAIALVARCAFGGDAEARLVDSLRQSSHFVRDLSLVAQCGDRVVGHILLSRARRILPEEEQEVLVLAPLAVMPSQTHRGIGRQLTFEALAEAERQAFPAVVVTGYPRYYQRLGFERASERGVTSNLPVPNDFVTVRELQPQALSGGGEIRYPEPFFEIFNWG